MCVCQVPVELSEIHTIHAESSGWIFPSLGASMFVPASARVAATGMAATGVATAGMSSG
jgi:hypothetical protein